MVIKMLQNLGPVCMNPRHVVVVTLILLVLRIVVRGQPGTQRGNRWQQMLLLVCRASFVYGKYTSNTCNTVLPTAPT
jgi:hypothetical protein